MRKPRPKERARQPGARQLCRVRRRQAVRHDPGARAEILRCFTPEGPILGNKDLAERTGLPKPTVSRFTYTLSRLGYLKADHISSKYQLGPAVLAIGYPLLATMTLRQLARPAMKELADYAGGSVSMGIRDRLNIVYVETSRSSSMFSRQLSDIGLSQPIAATAIGRAYLAACTPGDREAICNEIRIKTPEDLGAPPEEDRAEPERLRALSASACRGATCGAMFTRSACRCGVCRRGEIVVFNCALQSFLVKPGQIRSDIGPRLAAMVRGLAAGLTRI